MRCVALIALALAGCVTADTEMLDDRTAIISAGGSGSIIRMSQVVKRVMLEAATMARTRGYDYFQILSAENSSRTGLFVSHAPTTTDVTGSATCTGYTCSGSATGTTWGGSSLAMPFVRPGADVTVRFYRSGEIDPNAPGVFSANAVLAQTN